MNIQKTMADGILTVALEGRLDTTTAPELEASLSDLDPVSELVLDFAGLEYVSSAGLRVLLKAQKIMNIKGTMRLVHVCDAVKEVFDITGFSDILTVE